MTKKELEKEIKLLKKEIDAKDLWFGIGCSLCMIFGILIGML